MHALTSIHTVNLSGLPEYPTYKIAYERVKNNPLYATHPQIETHTA